MRANAGPATNVADLNPSDTSDLNPLPVAVFVGVGGDVKITAVGGGTSTLKNVPSGTTLPVSARRVFATGTTASNLVALY